MCSHERLERPVRLVEMETNLGVARRKLRNAKGAPGMNGYRCQFCVLRTGQRCFFARSFAAILLVFSGAVLGFRNSP